MSNHRCPVCRRSIHPTAKGNIGGHADKAGNICETTGEPFRIAEVREHRKRVPKGYKPMPPANAADLESANRRRTTEAARRRVMESRKALRVLKKHAFRSHEPWMEALEARLLYPHDSLAEIASHLGISKDTYSARLRRAIDHATRMERNTAA